MAAPDELSRVGAGGQGADAQQVELGQAQGLDVLVVELGDEKAFGRPLDRHYVGQRAGRDDQPAGMDTQVVRLAQQAVGLANDRLFPGVADLGHDLLHRAAGAPPGVGRGSRLTSRLMAASSRP